MAKTFKDQRRAGNGRSTTQRRGDAKRGHDRRHGKELARRIIGGNYP